MRGPRTRAGMPQHTRSCHARCGIPKVTTCDVGSTRRPPRCSVAGGGAGAGVDDLVSVLHVWARCGVPRRPPAGLPHWSAGVHALAPRLPLTIALFPCVTPPHPRARRATRFCKRAAVRAMAASTSSHSWAAHPVAVQNMGSDTVRECRPSDGRSAWHRRRRRTGRTFRRSVRGVQAFSFTGADLSSAPAGRQLCGGARRRAIIPIVSRWMREPAVISRPISTTMSLSRWQRHLQRRQKPGGEEKTSCAASTLFCPERGAKGSHAKLLGDHERAGAQAGSQTLT